MKIIRLSLKNFRNHAKTALELDWLNVIAGPNAGGKSSIKQALEMVLTGRCEATDRGGRGADDLIRVGEKKAVVAARLESLGEVVRTISPSGSKLQVAGWTGSLKVQQELLLRELGVDADLIAALINVSDFIGLSPKDQAVMLHRLLPAENGVLADIDGRLREVLAEVAGNLAGPMSPDDFEAAHKRLYEARREAKKQLDQARGRLSGLEASASAGGHDPGLLPEMRRQLAELEERKAALEALIAGAKASADRQLFLNRQAERIRADMAEMEAKQKQLPKPDPNARERLDALSSEIEEARSRSAALAAEIRGIDAALAAMKKAGGKCPLAPELISCPLQGAEFKRLAKGLDDRRKGLVAAHGKAQREVAELSYQADEASSALSAAEESARLAADIAGAREELAAIEAEAQEAGSAGIPEGAEAELAELAGRIHQGYTALAETELAERNREAREAARADIDRLEARVEALEKLVALFGPGPEGLRSRQLSGGIAAAEDRINDNLEKITGGAYRVQLETEPEFHVVVHGPAGKVELRQLSNSERMRVGVAIAEALAHLSGLRLLVIDDAEILDPENRALLSDFLLGLREEYDTILLLYTGERERVQAATAPGVAVFWVEAGRVEQLR